MCGRSLRLENLSKRVLFKRKWKRVCPRVFISLRQEWEGMGMCVRVFNSWLMCVEDRRVNVRMLTNEDACHVRGCEKE